ncbi:hypothetical protein Ahia01_000048000 [Argonauta hians]
MEDSNMDCNISIPSLRNLIHDEFYQQLVGHFLVKGRSTQCELPQANQVTNRLLLQLYFLKQQENSTYLQLKEKLQKVVPDMETVSWSRVYQRVLFILNTCSEMSRDNDVADFLNETFDFHRLSDPLTAIGLNRRHFSWNGIPYTKPKFEDISNIIVVELEKVRCCERESKFFVTKWVKILSLAAIQFSDSQITKRITKCLAQYKTLIKQKYKSDDGLIKLDDFLGELFFGGDSSSVSHLKSKNCEKSSNTCKESKIIRSRAENETLKIQLKLQEDISKSLSVDKNKAKELSKELKVDNFLLKKQLYNYEKELEEIKKSKIS